MQSLTANFALIDYQLTVTIDPESAGSVSGEGTYNMDDEVTLEATANEGYEFVKWTGDIEHIDDVDSETITITMPAHDVVLTAKFKEDDTSIKEMVKTEVSIFPNPARSKLTVNSNESMNKILLMNTNGQVIKEKLVYELSYQLNVNDVQTGMYLLQIYTDSGLVSTRVQVVR